MYGVQNGIADFVGNSCGWLNGPFIEQGRREGWVRRNWVSGCRRWLRVADAKNGKVPDWGRLSSPDDLLSDDEKELAFDVLGEALESRGASGKPVILDLATGPSGGFLTLTLLHDPEAQVLLNDILFPLLEEWQAVLRADGAGPNVGFVAADARQLPLRTESIDLISGVVPFTEVLAPQRAVAEAYRVLRKGGRLVVLEVVYVQEDTARLSSQLRAHIQENSPGVLSGTVPFLREAGFSEVTEFPGSVVDVAPEEGTIPTMAAAEGVSLRLGFQLVTARKSA